MASLAGAIELPGRRDRGAEQPGTECAFEPHHAGIGQLDFQIGAYAGIDDRHRHEVAGAAAAGVIGSGDGWSTGIRPEGGAGTLLDPSPPVVERRDTDAELSAEVSDGQVGLLLPLELYCATSRAETGGPSDASCRP